MREAKSQGVRREVRAGGGYHSDQGVVWREVEGRLAAHRVASPTASYADLARSLAGRVGRVTAPLRPQAGQQGVLALAGGRAVALDLFDRPESLAAVWHGLVGSYAADALVAGAAAMLADAAAAAALAGLAGGEATSHEGVGLGDIVFLTSATAVVSALVVGEAVVHLAALWAAEEPRPEAAGRRSWFGEAT